MKIFALSAVMLVGLLSGCAYKVSPYGTTSTNQAALRKLGLSPVAVKPFTGAENVPANDVMCRAAGPINASVSYVTYIQQSLEEELKVAGLYDPNSPIILNGKVQQIDFSSGMSDGKWIFTLETSNSETGKVAKTSSTMQFSGSFVADKACQETAQAFSQGVQQLMLDTFNNPDFKAVASK